MYQTLLTTLEESIFIITINRPDKLNAINSALMTEIGEVIEEVNNNPAIHSALITGAGSKAFIAGADISELTGTQSDGIAISKKGQEVYFKIENSRKPVIAAINGFALGGGLELAMACHFRIASDNAKFGQPEVNLGLVPGYGATHRLPQLIGKGRALQLLMTAEMINAATALQYGLVNEVVSPELLLTRSREILKLINSKAPLAIAGCIEAVNEGYDNKKGYSTESKLFGDCLASNDFKEGKSAFLEKRQPDFKGK